MSIRDLVPWTRRTAPLAKRENGGDPFLSLREEMNRLFDSFHTGFDLAPFADTAAWTPKINVTENENAVLVSAELPGMDEKDIQVSYEHGVLSIRGEKKQETEEKEKKAQRFQSPSLVRLAQSRARMAATARFCYTSRRLSHGMLIAEGRQ